MPINIRNCSFNSEENRNKMEQVKNPFPSSKEVTCIPLTDEQEKELISDTLNILKEALGEEENGK